MAGIYIHIPFCRQFCSYCDFYRVKTVQLIPDFLDALKMEIALRCDYLAHEEIESIYIGGGTPSLLDFDQINSIFSTIGERHQLKQGCEITLEANPDDLNPVYIRNLKESTPVNRLSIGIQSFSDDDLSFLKRRHSASQSFSCIDDAARAGFVNISIDLIYGLPGMTTDKWGKNLKYAFGTDIKHVSAYHLTLEPGTRLYRMVKKGKLDMPADEQSHAQYMQLCSMARAYGYQHYEISNLSRDGYHAIHNSAYWKQKKYLGLGPAAHSFDLKSRQWNVSNVLKYIQAMQNRQPLFTYESLDETKRYNEYIMLSMRTIWGVNQKKVMRDFGESAVRHFLAEASGFIGSGQIIRKENLYTMTEETWFISDHIISRLLQD